MKKHELVAELQKRHTTLTKAEIKSLLDDLARIATNYVAVGDTVVIPNLVKIGTKTRSPRTGRNPATGESIEIPAKVVPSFKALTPLRDAVL